MVMALVFVREKLDTADMSSFYLLDKEILVHPSSWTFTSHSGKKREWKIFII